MQRTLVHVIAIVVALTGTVGGLALTAWGGMRIWQAFMMLDFANRSTATGLAIQLAGIGLLAVAALTGLWSSAGLLTVGLIGVVSLVLSALPLVLFELFRFLPGAAPVWYESVVTGLPQVICTVLGMTGVVLLLSRAPRSPRATNAAPTRAGAVAGQLAGLLVAPVLLLVGLLLMLRGLYAARTVAQIQAGILTDPLWLIVLIAGFLFVAAAVVLARWSPFALLLPAVVIAVASGLSFMPDLLLPLSNSLPSALPFLVLCGVATAAVLIACSAVILVVRHRTRRARPPQEISTLHHPGVHQSSHQPRHDSRHPSAPAWNERH